MSVRVTNWVWHDERTSHLKGNAFTALLALADIADDEGHVVYARGAARTQDALAKKARMSVATFRRVTSELVDEGLLSVSRETQRSENEYRILLTAQIERSKVSGVTAQIERSDRSQLSGHTSYRRTDVSNVLELVPPGPSENDRFDEFWSVYPRRVGKAAARKAFRQAARNAGAAVVVAGARRFAADPNLPDPQFIPYPATWLNRGSWDDEPLPPRVASTTGPGSVREEQFAPGDEWLAFNR